MEYLTNELKNQTFCLNIPTADLATKLQQQSPISILTKSRHIFSGNTVKDWDERANMPQTTAE